jgi:CHAT domain-containing protein/Tfp pilus assembly protein PilF
MLTVQQVDGTVELRLPAEASADSVPRAPFTNKSGLQSKIHILLNSGSPSNPSIRISNPSQKTATVFISIGPISPDNAFSEQERTAEVSFARAELLRSQSADKSSEILAAYDLAIADWRAAGNEQDVARALIWKAFYVFFGQNDPAAAQPIALEAGKLIPSLEPVEAANCWKITGFIHAQLAQYDAGADAYRAALALFDETGDLFNQEVVLDNLAKLERLQGQMDAALRDAKKAADLAAKLGDPRRRLGIQEEIGAIYLTEGDLESAYEAYEGALVLLNTAPDPRLRGYIWSDMGVLYTQLGDFARAADALEQAMAVWKANSNPAGELNTLDDYGDLLLKRNQPDDARRYYTRGLELAEKSSIDRARVFLLRGIGKSYLQRGDTIGAEESLQRSLKLAREVGEGDSIAETLCLLGDTAWQRHDLPSAGQDFEQCRKTSVATHDTYMEIQAEGGLARVALQTGALENAESHCEIALGEIEAEREHLRADNLQTLFFASLHAYYDLDVQILMRLDQTYPQEGYRWKAFLAAERSRSRTLLGEMTAANAPLRATASSALLAQYEDVERRLRVLEASADRQRKAQGGEASSALRSAIARLTVSEHQLHREVQATAAPDRSLEPGPPLTLEALENVLPDRRATLVEYWTGEKASYAWSITSRGIRSFRLPPVAELDRQCTAFRKALLAASSPDPRLSVEQRAAAQPALESRWRKLGAQLATTLFPSGILSPSTSTVLVVGDGPIESVPFAALPGISFHAAQAPFSGVTFVNEPSATILSFLEAEPAIPHPTRVVIFAAELDPFNARPAGVRQAAQSSQKNEDARYVALPFAGDEAAMLRALFGADATQTYSGASVSSETLQNLDWSQFSIAHFAMHAVLNERYAELSGLSPGSGQPRGSAKLLWYGDLCHLHTQLELVVLSACNTALGERIPGEGRQGLTQAFLAAGSRRVLGTLWEVDDQATSEWMRYFYQELRQTRSPAAALHQAQERMAADPQWSSPYYWAGFVLAGDWRPLP